MFTGLGGGGARAVKERKKIHVTGLGVGGRERTRERMPAKKKAYERSKVRQERERKT